MKAAPPLRRGQATAGRRALLDRAYVYYQRIAAGRGRESQLFPTKASGLGGQMRYQAQPRTDALRAQIERVDGMTDEERAALAEDDGGGADDTTNTDADNGAGGDDGKGSESAEDKAAAGNDDAAADAAASAASDAKADDGAAAATEAQPQQAPILVAQVPENVDAKLAEITTQKGALLDQFDNGDITAKEYQLQLDALAKQERQIERQQEALEKLSAMI